MRELNPQFYFDIDLGDDNRIRHVFLADARSRATWDSFGDILCFDTTYLTNKYDMPFATFFQCKSSRSINIVSWIEIKKIENQSQNTVNNEASELNHKTNHSSQKFNTIHKVVHRSPLKIKGVPQFTGLDC